jgi:hypothetical protein
MDSKIGKIDFENRSVGIKKQNFKNNKNRKTNLFTIENH